MELQAGCPQCPLVPTRSGEQWTCELHGAISPLWRARKPEYAAFAEHLERARPLPTWLPWPMPPGWHVTDFGSVGVAGSGGQAVFATCTGPSDLDGVVEITVVTEEPGVSLGARCAQVAHTDPGPEAVDGAPAVKIRVGQGAVRLWTVPTSDEALMDDSIGE